MLKLYVTIQSMFIAGVDRVRSNDEKGATAVEYGLMVALIAVAIIVAVGLLGTNLSVMFNAIAAKVGAVVVP
ncbi:Flp family type IVb pilin [Arthrobacter psychrolactophilus]